MSTTPAAPRAAAASTPAKPTAAAAMIRLDDLIPSKGNVRSRLGDLTGMAASIREVGILQALLVRPHPSQPGKYLIVAGHRRHAAARLAGRPAVPCLIRSDNLADETSLMLVENGQRQDLDPVDMARAFAALAKKHPLSTVARMTGFSTATVRARIGLLDLPQEAQEMVSTGDLTLTDAADLVSQIAALKKPNKNRTGAKPTGVTVNRHRAKAAIHFDKSHRLAAHAEARCTHQDLNRRAYGPACGPCWEAVIRDDALGTLAPLTGPNLTAVPNDFDAALVERIVNGSHHDRTCRLTPGDTEEIVRRLHRRGYSDQRIAAQAGVSDQTVYRTRKRLGLSAVPVNDMVPLAQ